MPPLPKKVSSDVERTLRQNTVYGVEKKTASASAARTRMPSPKTPRTVSKDVLPYIAPIGSRASRTPAAKSTAAPKPNSNVYNTPEFLAQRANARKIIADASQSQPKPQTAPQRPKQLPVNPPKRTIQGISNATGMPRVSSGYLGESVQSLFQILPFLPQQ